MKTFGQEIGDAIRAQKRTLDQVARNTGTHKGYISGIVNGKVNPPAWRMVRRLAKYLGLDYQMMLALSHWEKRPKDLGILAAFRLLERIKNESALCQAEEVAILEAKEKVVPLPNALPCMTREGLRAELMGDRP
jgi:transcriptional regulator with XRE-family HTH domain